MASNSGQGAKVRLVLALAGQIRWRSFVACFGPLPSFRSTPARVPPAISQSATSFAVRLVCHADRELIPTRCAITRTEHRFGAYSEPFGLC